MSPQVLRRPASGQGSRALPVPAVDCHPYFFHKLQSPAKLSSAAGTFFGIEYCIRRQSTQVGRPDRSQWGVPRRLSAERSEGGEGRHELHVKLYSGGSEFHTTYHRLVAMSFLGGCYWSDSGSLLKKPVKITLENRAGYDVHHVNGNPLDMRLRNLAIVSKTLHKKITHQGLELPRPSVGWGK